MSLLHKILIVSCTQEANKQNTLMYKSVQKMDQAGVDLQMHSSNKIGLPRMYNKHLTPETASYYQWVVFCHDDVWLDENALYKKLQIAKLMGFDIVGVAGTLNPKIQHPALWHIMGERNDHRGYAGHLMNPYDLDCGVMMTSFGPTPDRVAIIDGVFMAVNIQRALEVGWRFNEEFEFHHYDIASCIDANEKKLKVAVCPINLFHASPGLASLEDPAWSASNKKFLELYS